LNALVTVVLPVYNVERLLRREVLQILDLADILGRQIQLAVIDDGSTDGTFEIACELERQFPQLFVIRQPFRSGLGNALEQVRARLGVEQVVAHDGVGAIDLDELAHLLAASPQSPHFPAPHAAVIEGRGSRRVAAQATPSSRLTESRRSGASFRWLRLDEPMTPRRKQAHATSRVAASNAVMEVSASRSNAFAAPLFTTT
jgi:glycosyltransferase involved in cell wall biosynthesis